MESGILARLCALGPGVSSLGQFCPLQTGEQVKESRSGGMRLDSSHLCPRQLEPRAPWLASNGCLGWVTYRCDMCVISSVLDPQGFSDLAVPTNQPGFSFQCRVLLVGSGEGLQTLRLSAARSRAGAAGRGPRSAMREQGTATPSSSCKQSGNGGAQGGRSVTECCLAGRLSPGGHLSLRGLELVALSRRPAGG